MGNIHTVGPNEALIVSGKCTLSLFIAYIVSNDKIQELEVIHVCLISTILE